MRVLKQYTTQISVDPKHYDETGKDQWVPWVGISLSFTCWTKLLERLSFLIWEA